MTLNDLQSQIAQLQAQNGQLTRLNDDLNSRIGELELAKGFKVLSAREETNANLPTGLSTRSPLQQNQ